MSTSLDWLNLDTDEELIWSGTPRIQTLYSVVGFAIMVTIAPAIVIDWQAGLAGLAVGSLVTALAYLHLVNTEFAVTTKCAYSKRGIYGRSVTKIALRNIQDTSFSQGILGRTFDYGTLFFSTAGGDGNELSFKHINHPKDVQATINEQLQTIHTHTTNTPADDAPSQAELFAELTDEMKQIRELIETLNTQNNPTEDQQETEQ